MSVSYREVYKDGKLILREPLVLSEEEIKRDKLLKRLEELRSKRKESWDLSDIKDLIEILLEFTGI